MSPRLLTSAVNPGAACFPERLNSRAAALAKDDSGPSGSFGGSPAAWACALGRTLSGAAGRPSCLAVIRHFCSEETPSHQK